ncbi:response regulator transcription factor [Leucobacter allii]|uniref:response regulator n=1 Tax=Leucobacter allii TaxID=2932247 RepID=UPI001FCFC1DB|nr:response regulator transcription factor [Leucobacter allii]UOR01259.1 response regulator transcription factor [Leucobacter allii]
MIRVLVVDDQELVRSGFRIILESEPDIEVVGEAADGAAAVALARRLSPDVICMDVEMPGLDGIEASRSIMSAAAGAGEGTAPAILVLTTFGHERYLFDALAAGVSGFLLKSSRAEQLIEAVRALADGQALLGPDVTRAVIARVSEDRAERSGGADGSDAGREGSAAAEPVTGSARAGAEDAQGTDTAGTDAPGADAGGGDPLGRAMAATGLTEREREVLRLVAEGRSNGEIAAALFLGEATVKTHVSNTLQKLGVRDRIQAVVWAHTREG